MSNPNPFEFLRNLRADEGEQVERPDNPFADLIQGSSPHYMGTRGLTPPIRRGPDRFIRGVGRGFLHPVRAFTGDLSEDGGTAGSVGEAVGALAGFVPFFAGARKVAMGVGLAKPIATRAGTKLGLSNLGHFVAGTTSYAAYETFAGDTVEEAPARFRRALVEGAAFEAAFLGVAAAWRRRFPRFETSTRPEVSPIAATPETAVHPLALKIEQWIRPAAGDNPGVLVSKLQEIGNPQAQLHESFMKIVHNHMGGGHIILPGVNQREIKQIVKAAEEMGNIKLRPYKRFSTSKGDALYDLLVYDKGRSSLIPDLVKGRASLDEILKGVKKDFNDLNIEFPDIIYHPRGNPLGTYQPSKRLIRIAKKSTRGNEYVQSAVLLHEVAHHLTHTVTLFRGKNLTIGNIFVEGYNNLPDAVKKALPAESKSVNTLIEEMKRVTEEVEVWSQMQLSNVSESVARKRAKETIANNADYFYSDHELPSRLIELMFFNPRKAAELAPNSTTFFASLLQAEAPQLRSLLSRGAAQFADYLNDLWVRHGDEVMVFRKAASDLTPAQLNEWGKTGFFRGMRGFVDGKEVMLLKNLGKSAKVRNLQNGKTSTVKLHQFQRPLATASAARSNELIRAIDNMLEARPSWVALNLTQPLFEGGVNMGEAVRRAIVNLEDFHFVEGPLFSWVRSLPEEIQEQIVRQVGTVTLPDLSSLRKLPNREAEVLTEQLDQLIKATGKKGMAYYNNGQLELLISDRSVFQLGALESPSFGSYVAGSLNSKILVPSMDDVIKTMLREKGVAESDLPYFLDIARDRMGHRIRNLVDPNVRQAVENVETVAARNYQITATAGEETADVVADVTRGLDSSSARAGMETRMLDDGRIELRDSSTKSVLGRFADEGEALEYVREVGLEGNGPDFGNLPGAGSHGGNGVPPKFQAMLAADPPPEIRPHGRGESVTDALNILGIGVTALENVARSAERKGFGPAFTKVFDITQRAIAEVDRYLAEVKRDLLGGVSYNEYLRGVAKKLSNIPRKRQERITQYMEYMTKDEVAAPGGLLQRGMRDNEIRVAKAIEQMGLGQDIPRLMSVKRLAESAVKSESALARQLDELRAFQTTPEVQQLIQVFESLPRFRKANEVYEYLGLTADERQVLKIIDDSMKAGKDKFSIYAVSRYASAPELKKGFKSGREQFAAEFGMTKRELEVANDLDRFFQQTFSDSGLDQKRMLGGYWPHLRQWTSEGLIPDDSYLPPDVLDWVSLRFRSGELDIYNMDPLGVAFRHARGMAMKEFFDPIMPTVRDGLKEIRTKDQRLFRVFSEYVDEIIGKPHASFGRAQRAIESSMEVLFGRTPPPDLVRNTVSTLTALAASATIPFRPALILRNYAESILKVAPRTGLNYYMKGLKYVTDSATRKEAFLTAKNAQAITAGPQRLRSFHGATEAFGPGAGRLNYKLERLLEKGFDWYQSADDWGRAIAFHAQRFRLMDSYDAYRKGRINFDQMLERAKVLTYDPLDIQAAEKMLRAGDVTSASNYLGRSLSRETMNRYGHGNHPAGWNSIVGRLMGQFGTWPVQYKDYLMQGLTRGTTKDKAEFAMIHSAVSGAFIAGGAAAGLNLSSWIGFPSLNYTGGPFAGMAIDVVKSVSGSDLEKQLAQRNLIAQIPIYGWMATGNPRSIFMPGSYLLGDLSRAAEFRDTHQQILQATGLRVMRPKEKTGIEWLFDF